jgi:ribosomal protein S18 acetylase RimI-like enzyme
VLLLCSLRPVVEEDDLLLKAIYGHTRTEELKRAVDWNEVQKAAFITHQHTAQSDYYKKVYPNADYSIILVDGKPAGRLYVERHLIDKHIRIIDIAILPAFRNQGIGAYFLKQLQEEAKQSNKILSIHVEKFNRALTLYKRIGFEVIKETHGVYYLMQWNTPQTASSNHLQ